jgi:hypothetical protein
MKLQKNSATTTTQSLIRKTLQGALSIELKETQMKPSLPELQFGYRSQSGHNKQAINHDVVLPPDSSRNVLMGYRYALHQQGILIQQERSKI